MSKEEICIQFVGDVFMFSEFLAIVSSDGMRMFRNRLKQTYHSITHQVSGALSTFCSRTRRDFRSVRDTMAWRCPLPTMVSTSQSPIL